MIELLVSYNNKVYKIVRMPNKIYLEARIDNVVVLETKDITKARDLVSYLLREAGFKEGSTE